MAQRQPHGAVSGGCAQANTIPPPSPVLLLEDQNVKQRASHKTLKWQATMHKQYIPSPMYGQHISLGHSVPANTEQIHIFPGFSQLLVQCTKMSLLWGGGMCMLFKICEKRPFQKCMGWGGVGGHSFAHRAVQGRTHRAQAMVQGSLIIPNPIRRHRCPFPQGPGLHWGTHPRACDWEHISSVFPNPAACVA